MRILLRIFNGLAPGQIRLAGFIALSIALHLITVFGTGPLDLAALRPGAPPARTELHATLVTGENARPAPAPSPDAENRAPANTAPTVSPPAGEGGSRPERESGERGLALPAPDKWFTASEVDVRAEPISDIRLRYPPEVSERVVGKVRMRLFIDEGGVVRKMQIAESEPSGVFDEAAKRDWQDVRFSPARKAGVAVKSQKLIELTYSPTLN